MTETSLIKDYNESQRRIPFHEAPRLDLPPQRTSLSDMPREIMDKIIKLAIFNDSSHRIVPCPLMHVSKTWSHLVAPILFRCQQLDIVLEHSSDHRHWITCLWDIKTSCLVRRPAIPSKCRRWVVFRQLTHVTTMMPLLRRVELRMPCFENVRLRIAFEPAARPVIDVTASCPIPFASNHIVFRPDVVAWINQGDVCSFDWIASLVAEVRKQFDAFVARHDSRLPLLHVLDEMMDNQLLPGQRVKLRTLDGLHEPTVHPPRAWTGWKKPLTQRE